MGTFQVDQAGFYGHTVECLISDPAVGTQGNRWKNASQLCPVLGLTAELLVPNPFIPHSILDIYVLNFQQYLFDNDFIEAQQCKFYASMMKVRKVAKIRNQYNQVPHLTQDTTWKVTKTQLSITNKSQ